MKYLFLILPVLSLLSCDTTKNAGQETMQPIKEMSEKAIPVNITYKRGPCMGKCPVFTMEIDEKGEAKILGRKYARLEGEHTKTLTASDVEELQKLVAEANFMSLEDKYDSGILDAATVTMSVTSAKGTKNITLRGALPDALKPLQTKLTEIYNYSDWTATNPTEKEVREWSYTQGPCFGKCPVYSMFISSDGTATLNGKRFANKEGKHSRKISEEELLELQELFKTAQWFRLDDNYDSKISDAARTTINYDNRGMEKQISFRGKKPDAAKPIIAWFRAFYDAPGWIKVEDTDYGLPAGTIANELIIKLKPEANIKDFVASYIKQDMKLKKTIAPTMNMHLVTFDPDTSTPKEMISWIKERDEVMNVEFNKEVSGRED